MQNNGETTATEDVPFLGDGAQYFLTAKDAWSYLEGLVLV